MIPVIKADLDVLLEKVIEPCRKGLFIYLLCDNAKLKNHVKKQMKKFKFPFKRGLYTWKGIIVLATYISEEYKIYFDKIYRVI